MTTYEIVFQVAPAHHDDAYWERLNHYYRSIGHPVLADYPDPRSYEQAWYRWRALEREHGLNAAEADAKWEALQWAIDRNRRVGRMR